MYSKSVSGEKSSFFCLTTLVYIDWTWEVAKEWMLMFQNYGNIGNHVGKINLNKDRKEE